MKVAVIQLNSKSDKQENLRKAKEYIIQAVQSGAELISLPEYFNFMGEDHEKRFAAESIPNGETPRMLSELARENEVFIHAGSIVEKFTEEKSYNTSFIINPNGEVIGKYNKIHLFDIEINGMPSYKESSTIQGGDSPVLVDLPFGKAGLSICYDLRFPELFRNHAVNGAKVLFVPAAFTQYTGMLHWEVLLRARAIENQCYVIAAGQYGSTAPGKACYGNSMIIDPWGTVIARAPEDEGFIMAEMKMERVENARESIPCLAHRKLSFVSK
ncbi:carbon-nitrogen hydrolase family protein [Neobacillus mesonae]|uniref:carbon-nitrogen hydrolase family protein n=1 Tax=Neobacillus mesonae TaxID=1193713 RepID=UPI002040FF7F|nr:carbon-nitrogen hydrolase family protein [Neobacillus mesonae]MCM3569040.1 carbon-nitrogen hydrolase family protein [Neobacillus mesonae]